MVDREIDIDAEAERQAKVFRAERRRTKAKSHQWILLIKELRVLHQVGLLDAERLALSNPHRRRWVEMIVNTRHGKSAAISHINENGDRSLLREEAGHFYVNVF